MSLRTRIRSRSSRTPIARLNLVHDPRRLATSLAGVGFAVVLMFTELGFRNALFDSTTALIGLMDPAAELAVIQADKDSLIDSRRFPRRRLYQAEGVAGVAAARPLYFERMSSIWEAPTRGRRRAESRRIRVVAADPIDGLLRLPHGTSIPELPGTALFDTDSKAGFDFDRLAREAPSGDDVRAVLSRRPIRIVGTFRLGTDFANDGTLIVAARTFARFFPARRLEDVDASTVDVGLLRLADDADPGRVRAALRRILPSDVVVLTRPELIDHELEFWNSRTPIGPIFLLGTILGFVVGVVICYQVLSSDVRDHLAEYATMKAIGYPDREPVRVVYGQAAWLAVLGFALGAVVSAGIYAILAWLTGLPMRPSARATLVVFALTLIMCRLSARLAIRKLLTADPAELFR